MTKSKIICLAVLALLTTCAVHAWADEPREYDPTVPPWMRTFYYGDLGGPEYRGPWVYGIDRLGMDKGVDKGYIPMSPWKGVYRSRGDGGRVNFWEAGSGVQVAGLSFSNDISAWLNPPEGMTRSIRYSILQDWSGSGGPNNSDIIEIDENQVEALMKHGGRFGPDGDGHWLPPHDTLGQEDPWGVNDVGISGFDYKADLTPHRGWYDHINALANQITGNTPEDYYNGAPQWSKYQSGEDMYFAAGKTGQFDITTSMLDYGKRVNKTWGSGDGSGYGELGRARFDTRGTQSGSGENFGRYAYYSDGRWWNYVVIAETTYWLYLQNSDGSIRDYDADIYPEDSEHSGDPEYASGHPIVWHDDYELEQTHGLDLGVDTYGEKGRYVIERASTTYWENLQAYTHAGDVMSETRTYNPIMNDGSDGPESQYEWLYDTSGDMHEPNWYYDGATRTPYAGEWDGDTPYKRALHLKAVVANWTKHEERFPTNGGIPPDEEHDWQYTLAERRGIEMPDGPPDTYWQWEDVFTGVLRETSSSFFSPPSLPLPDEATWRYVGPDPENPGKYIWETRDASAPEQTIEVTDWRAPEHNWTTYTGYSGADQHPAYPNDDQEETWTEWEWDSSTQTWSSYEAYGDCETNDWYIGRNNNDGIVSQQYFAYAWKIAGKLLGDRFWEDGYVWSTELGAVASRELVEDDLVKTMGTYSLRLPTMTWNATLNRWDFPTSYSADYPIPWSFQDHYVDHEVEGHEAINNFLRFVMDIDALVVQDVNGNGVYDEEEDYILFSLVDDGRFTKMTQWGQIVPTGPSGEGDDALFEGQYFDGDTIFLYHNCEVVTYFDSGAGIFFGKPIGTTPGSTLWSNIGVYDLNALDIGLVPEPATMILVIGAGLALGAGVMRRRLFK